MNTETEKSPLHFSSHAVKRYEQRFPMLFRKMGTRIADFLTPVERFNRDELFQKAILERYPDKFNPKPQPFVVYTYLDMLVLTRGGVVITLYHRISGLKVFEELKSDYVKKHQ